jgi:transketolase
MRDAFFGRLHGAMESDSSILVLSADLGAPALDEIRRDYAGRFLNVGIAEQNLVNVATGLALEGFTVFAYGIAAFVSMRAFEQVRVNLSMTSQVRPLNVNLIGLGVGLSYDMAGPSHHCLEDLSILRTLPHLDLLSPSDGPSAEALVEYARSHGGPKYLRFDGKPLPALRVAPPSPNDLERGHQVLRQGGDACLVTTGYMTQRATRLADRLAQSGRLVAVVDVLRFRGDAMAALRAQLLGYRRVVTLEEGFAARGGLDSYVLHACIGMEERSPRLRCFGIEDRFPFECGPRDALHERYGIREAEVLEALGAS